MPNTSPKAYEVESVTAAAPMSDALSSTSANIAPATGLSAWASPAAAVPASPNCPASFVPAKANAVTIIRAAAPRITTNAPIQVSARS